MGKAYAGIDADRQAFIAAQKFFMVATAPGEGRINVSPKGMDCFRILSPTRVAYLDITGSGNETAAHVLDNGRMTFMFLSFDATPGIVRLYGIGRLVQPVDDEWEALAEHFGTLPAMRQIFVCELDRVSTSCGYGVPEYEWKRERDIFPNWKVARDTELKQEWWAEYNLESIDGLPTGMDRMLEAN